MRRGSGAAEVDPFLVVRNAVYFIVSNRDQLTISQLLTWLRQQSQLYFLNIKKLLEILKHYSNYFYLTYPGTCISQIQVRLAFELKICEQPTKCRGYPGCKDLHICVYFIRNKCRKDSTECPYGHNLHSQQNFQILRDCCLEQINPAVVKEWIHNCQSRRWRASRPPKVCTYYNSKRGCIKNEKCTFLHLCIHFVKGSCKYGDKCRKSHELFLKRNTEILRDHGIDLRCDQHQILDMLSERTTQYEKSKTPIMKNFFYVELFSKDNDEKIPGRPFLIKAKSDCITIQWRHVPKLSPEFEYQIQYRKMPDGRWTTYNQRTHYDESRATILGLKSLSSYSFRVRLVDTRDEFEYPGYPFSPESVDFQTPESPALRIQRRSILVKHGNPEIYRLPTEEVLSVRNDTIKSRKLSIGEEGVGVREKTIMMVGATGCGKSTLIDGLANYLFEVNWEDNFRFTLVSLEQEERKRLKDQAVSQTEWITCYSIYPDAATKLDYALHIVDTPGFGDTRGLERDKEISNQIGEYFRCPGEKGMKFLDAVCFVVKAPDARLTSSQKYILDAVLSLFGKDIESNICTCITFAETQEPPVLASLAKTCLPHEKYFKFNNSALFANNKDRNSLAYGFWNIGKKSFDHFFISLNQLETRSLQMTNEVLKTRQDLENTVQNLQNMITAGMSKISMLEEEKNIFTKHKKAIEENKDFRYEVTEQVQEKEDISGKGQHTTNCLICNYTCHESCAIRDDSRKDHCIAINTDGFCKQCPGNCHWKNHHNNPYIIRWVSKKVSKTYNEKLSRYKSATEKVSTQKEVLKKMEETIKDIEDVIVSLLDSITACNNKLKKIALSENPKNTAEYIHLMMEAEKREAKPGYLTRMRVLEECRQKALVDHKAKDVLQKIKQTRISSSSMDSEDFGSLTCFASSIGKMQSLMHLA
ncbi:uncharacterized protein LOC134255428 [Saccostrea cucullata]|uniref:uncharacterized protein LOC134255428 n=1 Tax=Saccostrea cuccullata TaxID=36930 RepID=UPI002ED6301B